MRNSKLVQKLQPSLLKMLYKIQENDTCGLKQIDLRFLNYLSYLVIFTGFLFIFVSSFGTNSFTIYFHFLFTNL